MGCHVTVELPHKHHHQGKQHNVRIDIKVPGSEIVVNRDKHEDIYVALRDAFDAAKRQVEEYGRRQRGDAKHHAGSGRPRKNPRKTRHGSRSFVGCALCLGNE
ncbi:MAG: HPF/RaiA family ribosome-associated protein [Rhodocyclaceae bacterium]|nr:HPF/RaiA family ribosome-associated protein [Rhodocyclaceae bacterium]